MNTKSIFSSGTIGFEANSIVTPNEGKFFKITRKNLGNPTIIRSPVTNSNGLAWNKANTKLYYIDTPTLKVVEFDYDDETGTISAENRTAFDVAAHPDLTGHPDGMTIDDEDNLYICLYAGGSVVKVNSTSGKILQVIALPARDVTSAMWGGPNLDILFVTTSSHSLTPLEKLQFPAAGSLFAIKNLKAKGLPVFTADIIDKIPEKLNLLDTLFAPDILSYNNGNKNVHARGTEPSIWETVMGAIRNFF
ncbi:hypothetical protein JTB14_006317 [Gonioctena quinquepunctata]|nr:hypothetical protein JTB14_006317 [Gonioctena quinquepunctata]